MDDRTVKSGIEPSEFADDGLLETGESIGVANEFTGVVVRKVLTRNGERLELTTPKFGYRVLLDAMQLEIISTLTPEKFNELFARNLGSFGEGS
ncbi:MAG: hypothetical protein WCA31_11430 [Acidimicrobiales bacterium]